MALQPGVHLFLLQYSSDKYTQQQISAEVMIGESFWRLLDDSQTFQAGQGPSWLRYDVLSTKVDMPLVVKKPDYSGGPADSFSRVAAPRHQDRRHHRRAEGGHGGGNSHRALPTERT